MPVILLAGICYKQASTLTFEKLSIMLDSGRRMAGNRRNDAYYRIASGCKWAGACDCAAMSALVTSEHEYEHPIDNRLITLQWV